MRKCFLALLIPVLVVLTLSANFHEPHLEAGKLPLRAGLSTSDRVTVDLNQTNLAQALIMYSELTGRTPLPNNAPISQQLDEFFGGYPGRWHLVKRVPPTRSGIEYHRDGLFSVGEVKASLETIFKANGCVLVPVGRKDFRLLRSTRTVSES